MKVRILALGTMLALGASVATAQAPAKEKDKSVEHAKKHDKAQGKHAENKSDDDYGRKGMSWGSQRRLLGGIKLTDAQKTSIKAIHESYEPRMKVIRDEAKANKKAGVEPAMTDAMRTRAQALATQERAEIRAVLTAEQQVRFDQNVAKFDDRRDGRGKRGDRGNRGDGSR